MKTHNSTAVTLNLYQV